MRLFFITLVAGLFFNVSSVFSLDKENTMTNTYSYPKNTGYDASIDKAKTNEAVSINGNLEIVTSEDQGQTCPGTGFWFHAVASCGTGYQLISGGCEIVGTRQYCPGQNQVFQTTLWGSYPDFKNGQWICKAKNDSVKEQALLRSYAICSKKE